MRKIVRNQSENSINVNVLIMALLNQVAELNLESVKSEEEYKKLTSLRLRKINQIRQIINL